MRSKENNNLKSEYDVLKKRFNLFIAFAGVLSGIVVYGVVNKRLELYFIILIVLSFFYLWKEKVRIKKIKDKIKKD